MRAAVVAGVAAGIVSTLAQIVLWLALTDALPDILFRDARLAAAIVMGEEAFSSASLAAVMAVATLVHFALSIAFSVPLCALLARLPMLAAPAVGAAFGLALFAVNMYGFTALFPWFVAARDPITAAAHAIFGLSAAVAYRAAARRR